MTIPASPSSLPLSDPQRRIFLKAGLAGTLLLTANRWLPSAVAKPSDKFPFIHITQADVVALLRIIPVMLEDALPEQAAQQKVALGEILYGIDQTIGSQALATRREIQDLFGLLTKGITRALVAGIWTSWNKASDEDIQDFLDGWRTSRFEMLRSAYVGLQNLAMGSWYGNPRSWARIGYPGPPKIT